MSTVSCSRKQQQQLGMIRHQNLGHFICYADATTILGTQCSITMTLTSQGETNTGGHSKVIFLCMHIIIPYTLPQGC